MTPLKKIAFLTGFIMLLCLPMDIRGVLFYCLVWFPAAIGLLAWSGAFNNLKNQSHVRTH